MDKNFNFRENNYSTQKRNFTKLALLFLFNLILLPVSFSQSLNNTKHDGYRGIWFTLGQESDQYEGDKYSGGLAFCFSHTLTPMAIYSPEVDKTFFVYGGTTEADDNHLLIMASYYDHARHRIPRPTIVRDQLGVIDPHDNPSITIDDDGIIWVFIAGRGRNRPGQIFKATKPYSVDEFEEIISREQTYSQIWNVPGKGFMHLMTLYTAGRELYMETSEKGDDWTNQPDKDLQKVAGFGGHYQVSRLDESKQRIGSAFNYHPGGSVDRRTNVYYIETKDNGKTWSLKGPVTQNSPRNHSYLRRPHNPKDPFFGMWADGNSKEFSISHIYFTNSTGDKVYMLPYTMEEEFEKPVLLDPPSPLK